MKHTFLFLILGFSVLVSSCQKGDDPQPVTLTATDSLALQLSGSWESKVIQRNYYTNDELTNQDNSESVERYNFTKEGDFQLLQDEFSIKGKWAMSRSGYQLIVSSDSGDVLQWEIQTLSDEQLILYSSQTVMVGEDAQRLDTWVQCSRVIP